MSAKLLYTAIFSNTLNFKAGVTTDRDRIAFSELSKIAKLGTDWIERYYSEVEEGLLKDPITAISQDTKKVIIPEKNINLAIGQMELWNGKDFILKNQVQIEEVLEGFIPGSWFMTVPSISEGINYLYTKNDGIKKLLIRIIDAKFDGDLGRTSKLWLRKEILKKLLSSVDS